MRVTFDQRYETIRLLNQAAQYRRTHCKPSMVSHENKETRDRARLNIHTAKLIVCDARLMRILDARNAWEIHSAMPRIKKIGGRFRFQ